MLSKGDDYPIHQTPEPIAYVAGQRNFYDRYFFNGYDATGEKFFAFALGVYPYLDVMDAAFSFVFDGVQHNVLASKVMGLERLDLSIGPLSLEVVEPLQTLRIACDDQESGVKADLTFHAFIPAHEEPRFTRRVGSQLMMDVTRMMQNGTWSGWVEVDGVRHEVQPGAFQGTRDRSWGLRTVGLPDAQPNPAATGFQFFWIWAPMNFENFSIHYFVNQDESGEAWNENGVLVPKYGGGDEVTLKSLEYHQDYQSGTRHASGAVIKMASEDDEFRIELTPKWSFYMKGLGYGHETFRHGSYHGALDVLRERLVLSDMGPENLHIQAMCDVVLTTKRGQEKGQGVLEQLVIGPHAPSGFSGMMDFAS